MNEFVNYMYVVVFWTVCCGVYSEEVVRKTSNTCKRDTDCPEFAFCETKYAELNGFCVCRTGYTLALSDKDNSHICIKVAQDVNDSCAQDAQCTITLSTLSECRDGRCQCKEFAHFKDGKCYRTAKVGELCEFANNCYVGPGRDVYCVSGRCVCPLQQHPVRNGTDCVQNVELMFPCDQDDQCVAERSRCLGVCRCRLQNVIASNGTTCLPSAKYLGDPCEENAQCTDFLQNTVCKNNTCVCDKGYHKVEQDGQKCWQSVKTGGQCEYDQQCYSAGAKCRDGLCLCEGPSCSSAALYHITYSSIVISMLCSIFLIKFGVS